MYPDLAFQSKGTFRAFQNNKMCKNKNTYCCNDSEAYGGYCLYCIKEGYAEAKPPKKPYVIPKESEKRKVENKEYAKNRKDFLTKNKSCIAKLKGCTKVATTVHHSEGRIGKKLNDVKGWLPLCMNCHRIVEDNPKMAKDKNLSKSRLTKN